MQTEDIPQEASLLAIAGKSTLFSSLAEMNCLDQVLKLDLRQMMVAKAEATFFTSLGRKKFKTNFYRWSIRRIEQLQILQADVAAPQEVFLATLEKILGEKSLQSKLEQPGTAHSLKPEVLVVVILGWHSTQFYRTFGAFDRLLVPVFSALVSKKISRPEFDAVMAQVEESFRILSNSMDNILVIPKKERSKDMNGP